MMWCNINLKPVLDAYNSDYDDYSYLNMSVSKFANKVNVLIVYIML